MTRILVSMPEDFLKSIDKIAGLEHRSRSELVREALRTYIRRNSLNQNQNADKNAEILNTMFED